MLSYYYLDLLSIGLGLLAWVLPFYNIVKNGLKPAVALACLSAVCCAVSLFLQMVHTNCLVKIGAFGDIEDTIGAVVFAGAVMLITAFVLNIASLGISKKVRNI